MKLVLHVRDVFVMKLLLSSEFIFLLLYPIGQYPPVQMRLIFHIPSPALHLQLLTAKYAENLKFVPLSALWPIFWSVSDICWMLWVNVLCLQTMYYSSVSKERKNKNHFYCSLNLQLSAETGKNFTPFH